MLDFPVHGGLAPLRHRWRCRRAAGVRLRLRQPAAERCLVVAAQSGGADVASAAAGADERPLARVQPQVQLQVHQLCEPRRTLAAGVRPLPGVDAHVGLEVGRGAEALAAQVSHVRPLPWQHGQMGHKRRRNLMLFSLYTLVQKTENYIFLNRFKLSSPY